ncbi:RNA-directed DNA polymerase, eukaryota, nucleotide-binding alpha-beta plait domain protein [Tanacetum coccineum]
MTQSRAMAWHEAITPPLPLLPNLSWHICHGSCKMEKSKSLNGYGTVVDVFIPDRKSKAGKRFAFVRFIKVDNVDRLVGNLCTLWIGRMHLHANVARFDRPPIHSSNGASSFASVLKGNPNNFNHIASSPAMVLDDECVVERDLDNFVMGEVKDFSSINNLRVLLSNEGFQHVRLAYLGGLWVMIELTSVQTKMRFMANVVLRLSIVNYVVQGMENSLSKRRSEGLSSRVLEDAQPLNEHASPSIDSKKKQVARYWRHPGEVTCGVYICPQSITSKRSLWSYISSLISRWDGHCMVMGDFNEVRCMEDRLGSVLPMRRIAKRHQSGRLVDLRSKLCHIDKVIDQGGVNDDILLTRVRSPEMKCVMLCGAVERINLTGTDGFTFEFFRKFWDTLGSDFYADVEWFFDHSSFSRGCNSSFIALIPKNHDPKLVLIMSNSLMGVFTRLSPKILASTFVDISGLISDDQTAFLPNRQFLMGPFIINDIISLVQA